jgi:hypothetical protein
VRKERRGRVNNPGGSCLIPQSCPLLYSLRIGGEEGECGGWGLVGSMQVGSPTLSEVNFEQKEVNSRLSKVKL